MAARGLIMLHFQNKFKYCTYEMAISSIHTFSVYQGNTHLPC